MLDTRSELLFSDLIHGNENMNSQYFKDKYKWTRSQISYSLKNVNEWLMEQNYRPITRDRKGYFKVEKDMRYIFKTHQLTGLSKVAQEDTRGYFSSQKRRLLMEMILLMSKDYLSTYYFIDFIWVSKNTVLRDLRDIKAKWRERGLDLKYNREDGYYVYGSEWSKRYYLLGLVNVLVNEQRDSKFIETICQLTLEDLQEAHQILEALETHLSIQFSDDQVSLLTYFIPIICKRIQRGEKIDCLYEEVAFQEKLTKPQSFLKQTKVFERFDLSDEEERYFTLLILSANRRESCSLEPALYPSVRTSHVSNDRKSGDIFDHRD